MFRLQTSVTKTFETSEVRPRKISGGTDESFVVLTAGGRRVQGWIKIKNGDKILAASPVLLANPEVDMVLHERRDKAIRLSTLLPPTRQEMLWHGLFQKANTEGKTIVHTIPIHLVEGSRRLAEGTQKETNFLQTLGFLPDERKARGPDDQPIFVFEKPPKSQITPDR